MHKDYKDIDRVKKKKPPTINIYQKPGSMAHYKLICLYLGPAFKGLLATATAIANNSRQSRIPGKNLHRLTCSLIGRVVIKKPQDNELSRPEGNVKSSGLDSELKEPRLPYANAIAFHKTTDNTKRNVICVQPCQPLEGLLGILSLMQHYTELHFGTRRI